MTSPPSPLPTPELLAPGGDLECIRAAIAAGADAVYCGLTRFSARQRAKNLSLAQLKGVLRPAHEHGCKVYLTLNTLVLEQELPSLLSLLGELARVALDGIIVQDLGLLWLLQRHFAGAHFEVHASTQLTSHNAGQLRFLRALGAARVNLCRELSLDEIRPLLATAHGLGCGVEVFVHGAYCVSFSGICYLSSARSGRSGNRGRCSQPCRDRHRTTAASRHYPLNLRDNAALALLPALGKAGVDALKIEGRMKQPHYVFVTVDAYRRQLARLGAGQPPSEDPGDLWAVFNRGFSDGYLRGAIGGEMFVNSPLDASAQHLAGLRGYAADAEGQLGPEVYAEKARVKAEAEARIRELSLDPAPLGVRAAGAVGEPLTLTVTTPRETFTRSSEQELALPRQGERMATQWLDEALLRRRLRALEEHGYVLEQVELAPGLQGLFLPYSQLTALKEAILARLTGAPQRLDPLPTLEEILPEAGAPNERGPQGVPRSGEAGPCRGHPESRPDRGGHTASRLRPGEDRARARARVGGGGEERPGLWLLVDRAEDLSLGALPGVDVLLYRLPGGLSGALDRLVALFSAHPELVPWFPAVLIGEDYRAALALLRAMRPPWLVTDNSGLGPAARELGIPWVAGPGLNLTNSLALRGLAEGFGCSGAVVSAELNAPQIRALRPPEGFSLHSALFGPDLLLTSRQCLFQPVTGCAKSEVEPGCLPGCAREATIEDQQGATLHLVKTLGEYCRLFGAHPWLNLDLTGELAGHLDAVTVDLGQVSQRILALAGAPVPEPAELLSLFAAHLRGDPEAAEALGRALPGAQNAQYRRGL